MTEAVAGPIERIEVEVPLGLRILVVEIPGHRSTREHHDIARQAQEALRWAAERQEPAVFVVEPGTKLRWLEAS